MRPTRIVLLGVSLFLGLVRLYVRMERGHASSDADDAPAAYAEAAAPPSAPPGAITIPCPAERVGRIVHSVSDEWSQIRGMGKLDGRVSGVLAISVRQKLDVRSETLAVSDGVASRLRVSYTRREFSTSAGGDRVVSSPVIGKTYVLDRAAGVTTEAGRRVSADEERIVSSDFALEGSMLVGRGVRCDVPLTVGQRVELGPAQLAASSRTRRMAFVFKGVRDHEATYEIAASFQPTYAGTHQDLTADGTSDLDGHIVFDATTGELLRVEGGGPARMSFAWTLKGRRLTAAGAGKAYLNERRTVEGQTVL